MQIKCDDDDELWEERYKAFFILLKLKQSKTQKHIGNSSNSNNSQIEEEAYAILWP